jgi:hypothetical protein
MRGVAVCSSSSVSISSIIGSGEGEADSTSSACGSAVRLRTACCHALLSTLSFAPSRGPRKPYISLIAGLAVGRSASVPSGRGASFWASWVSRVTDTSCWSSGGTVGERDLDSSPLEKLRSCAGVRIGGLRCGSGVERPNLRLGAFGGVTFGFRFGRVDESLGLPCFLWFSTGVVGKHVRGRIRHLLLFGLGKIGGSVT